MEISRSRPYEQELQEKEMEEGEEVRKRIKKMEEERVYKAE